MSYRYEPLRPELREIRTLTLLPGVPSDPLRITIQKAFLPLDISQAPHYEALSYVWGSRSERGSYTVSIEPDNFANQEVTHLDITENLAVCLPYLRYKDRPRDLWVDAICMNQADLKEKSFYVRKMAEIFQFASRVIIWLGAEADSSTQALQTLNSLGTQVIVDWKARTMKPKSGGRSQGELDSIIYDNLDIILSLLARPWFERLWVQQEAKLSRGGLVMCGSMTLDWQVFRNALFCLWHFSQRHALPGEVTARMNKCYILIEKTSFLLNELIYHGRECKCSDPRDRVYALLGLISEKEKRVNIIPDYTKTPSQVYQSVVAAYLQNIKRLDPLSTCEMLDDNSTGSDAPSWVPDWSKPRITMPLHLKRHPEIMDAQAEIIGDEIICAKGIRISTIKSVVQVDIPDEASMEAVVEHIKRVAPSDVLNTSPERASTVDAFCRTLVADHFRERWNPPDGQEAIESEGRQLIASILNTSFSAQQQIQNLPTATRYLSLVRSYSVGRSLAATEDGGFGLVPSSAKPGDSICLLLGCKSPLILQPLNDSRDPQHHLVGEGYFDSYMAAEPFLGTLPEQFRNITTYDDGNFVAGFLDRSNGEIQFEDPRLEAKLGMSYRQRYGNGQCHEMENETALQIIAERGVELSEFCIV
ncbi:MAG: hypothetical protein M1820_009172 [Bogoriella megaspora]|nr:MAG: hypothetical protein M1820_009172 [Bogoriella megaspora]